MGCFDNLIALKGGCSETTLQSGGVYLNDIGINREFIERIITPDYAGVDDFVQRKIALATETLTTDVLLRFSPKFNSKSIVDGQRIGYYQDNMSSSAAIAATSKGIQTKLYNDTTFIKMYVSSISLFVNFSGAVSVSVWDLISNTLLDTISITAVAGKIVTQTVNKVYESDSREMNLIFIYNASTIAGFQTPLLNGYCGGCNPTQGYRGNKYVWTNGVKIANAGSKIQSNINYTNDTGGLSINYSLQCNHLNWLCTNANFMTLGLLYKTGDLIMEHALRYTEQMNSRTLDPEKLEKRKEMYDFEYGKQIQAVLGNLRIPRGDVCFVCNNTMISRTQLPA